MTTMMITAELAQL